MKVSTVISILLALAAIVFLTIRSMETEEQVIEKTKDAMEQAFEQPNALQSNYQGEEYSFYLPDELVVEEEDANNIILTNDAGQTFIVFYNALEGPTSMVYYQAAKDSSALLYESFSTEDVFGYIRIMSDQDRKNSYELQIGVGGVKLTTYTKQRHLKKDALHMLQIAQTIQNKPTQTK
ncbi:hypothetical protein DX933_06330 [Ornithinibacillus gellani]|uniref:hypothetical protein n=1 Tax=Ornithinibacillus gellani TaxID=2293253 RepID=UPI000F466D5F|nr:hypothetical protein [Ornithinibacillus gellani]TQS75429.1 hypothetical protein DX933_06330 [Ornithinibacillus gellani]